MTWVTTDGDMETMNRLTDVIFTMNIPADRRKLFRIHQATLQAYGLAFSENAKPMDTYPDVLEYFLFSMTAEFGEVIQDLITEEIE